MFKPKLLNIKIFAAIVFSFFTLKTLSQSYKFIYYLDKDLSSIAKEKAVIIGKGYEQNGSFILDCFLKATGKKIITATVKDSLLSELQGPFKTYYDNMKLESEGNYVESEMDGVWKYWNEDSLMTDSVVYSKGVRIAYANHQYYYSRPTLGQLFSTDRLKSTLYAYTYSFTDSLKNTFIEKNFIINNGKTRINYEVSFIGQRGLLKQYDSTGSVKTDSVFTKTQQEAEFAGGEDGWRNFLRTNLNANVPADNNAPSGKYTIIVRFIVNKLGILDDIKPENDPGYGMAKEAIRVVSKSGKWKPAIRYGKYINAYRRQPITFLIEN